MVFNDLNLEPLLVQAVFSGDVDEVRTLIYKKTDVNCQNSSSKISALHAAAHCGNSEIIDLLCNAGARVNSKDSKCLTPLHYACRSKNEESVRVLLKHQADVNARDRNWQAPLHVCATYNSANCAKLIVPLMQNIDVTDRLGRSALSHAAFSGNLQMVELLLENGANTNIHDKQERRPIHWATFVGYGEIIKILKKYGADINCIDKDRYTPLLVACASGRSEEILRLLIDLGATLNSSTIHDSSAFHLACLNGHDSTIKELLQNHLEMKPNEKGYHPIHYAAVSKRGAFCLELLINLGINVNWRANDGKTPLHICALHHSLSCAQILIYNGAAVNTQDDDKNTPLHLAALNGNELMISLLIQCDASINIRGANGMLPYGVAALHGHSECFKELESVLETLDARKEHFESTDDFGRTFMHLAALSGNADCIELFINCGCDINAVDKNGNTPLHYACLGPYMQCLLLLITAGAKLDAINTNGCTPLMYACAFDVDGRAVRTILTGRADATITDKFGYNALHYASLQGNKKVIELLLEKCKHLNLQENEKMLSPLHILSYYGFKEPLEVLASNVTNLDVQDKNGRTPLDLACFKGSIGCVECLLLNGANCDLYDNVTHRTALHAAAYNNNEDCIKLILMLISDKKNLINSRDKYQRTPLMIAVEQGHINTISLLITQQADIDATDDKSCTALHRAAALGYEECCVLLLRNNASPYIRDINGLLPLHYVVIAGHAQLLPLFLEYKYDTLLDNFGCTLLHYACFNGHSTCAETLCESELILNSIEYLIKNVNNRTTPLHCACYNGHEACVNFLIQNFQPKFNNFIELKDHLGRTALHICAINNESQCAALLIQSNANLNSITNNGDSALMLAAANNSSQILELLIENNANIKLSNLEKNTALHLALLNGNESCAEYLLDKINDSTLVNQTNHEGFTPLHLASAKGFITCVGNLLNKGANIWIKNNKSHTPLLSCAKNDQVAECLELMLSKFFHTIQSYDNNNSLFTSSTVLINNDVNMFINNVSSNGENLLQNNQNHNRLHNELNTTCTLNAIGTTIDESIKDHSVQSSDSEFY